MKNYKTLVESISKITADNVWIAMQAMYVDKGGMHPHDHEHASSAVEQYNAGNVDGAKQHFSAMSEVGSQRLIDLLNTEDPNYGSKFAYYVAARRVAENIVDFGKYNHRGFAKANNADSVRYAHAMLHAINADADGYEDGEDAGNIVTLVFDGQVDRAREELHVHLHPYTQESFWHIVDKWPTEVRSKMYHALGGPRA